MMQPNQLAQAAKELSDFDLGDFKIPKEIQDAECESYVCVCIKSKDNTQKTKKIHTSRLSYASVDKWEQMKVEVEIKRVKGYFGGQFSMVVILHNPTLPNHFGMDWQKAKALELLGKGNDSAFVAQQLGVKKEGIDLFIKSQKPKNLSPTQKGKVNELLEAGTAKDEAGLNLIADELDIELDRIKAYVDSLEK